MSLVEDIYALSPMQTGILFQSLYAGDRPVYLDQHAFELQGRLNEKAFEQAWDYLIRRHTVLRTSIHWEGVEEPLQVVHSHVELPLEHHDWTDIPSSEQQTRFDCLLADDRARGLEISKAPLIRLTLIRLGPESSRLVWVIQHLILDRWSIERILTEFVAIYGSLCRGCAIELAPVRPYSQYIGWIQAQDAARAEQYWRRRLSGFSAPTALPIDHAPGSNSGLSTSDRIELRLPESVTSDLIALARQSRVTLNTVIQGAWALLLSRYSGREDVVFGSTVNGRPPAIPGVDSMVGLFINSLPVRVKCPRSSPLVEWLQQLQDDFAELRDFEHSSLVQIQSWSEVPRGIPLFDSLVVVQNTATESDQPPAAAILPDSLDIRALSNASTVDFPLMLLVVPGRELSLWLSYDTGRYRADDVNRLFGHLRTTLEGFTIGAGRALNDVPLLTESEQVELADWNQTNRDYPLEGGIHDLIEAQAARTPDSPAVVFEGCRLSYAELNSRANRLAHWLRKQGAQPAQRGSLSVATGFSPWTPDKLVGLHMERSVELVVSILAILKAGGAYVPLDPTYPSERLAGMIRDAQPAVVLTNAVIPAEAEIQSAVSFIPIEQAEKEAESESSDSPEPVVSGDNLAYMIYTSGSTGTPKGAMNTHSAIRNRLLWMQDEYGLTGTDRVLQKTPYSFDVSVWEFLWPLMTGACLVVARPEGHKDPAYLSEVICSEQITTLHFVPSMLRAFLTVGDLDKCKSLKRVICSGEALPPDLVQQFFEALPNTELHNLYGPTEAAIDVTYYACKRGEEQTCIPIGRPIANTQIHILDRNMSEVPVGVPGELYIGGANLGRGYLNRADLTADRFVPNPILSTLNSQFSTRLYRTGDLCRRLPDGSIEFLGRLDHQVKVRGFRIELGEIETALLGHSDVRDCVVVARQDAPGESRLVAYIVGEASSVEIRDHLKATLPDYMIPSAFVTLESLPLSANGKVDRKGLPEPGFGPASESGTAGESVQEVLAEIWREVLRLERVGIHDSFFELGGHSLLATQVISRIRATFQIEIPIRSLFERPTIAELAVEIRKQLGPSFDSVHRPIKHDSLGPRPLSFSQQRLWFLDQLEPGNPVYNIANAVTLIGRLDAVALDRALQELIRRHEALRTTFAVVDDEAVQIVGDPATELDQIDLRDQPDREDIATRRIEKEARSPFDLSCGPLLRASLLRIEDEEHIFLITVHHIIADGWSLGVFTNELATLYNAYTKGEPSPLPDLPIQYADYATWQRDWLQGEALDRQLRFWKESLAGAPDLLELPTDRPRPPVRTFNGARKRLDLSPKLTKALKTLDQYEGVTLFMALLAAFQTLLYRYTGQDQIVVGTPIANRMTAETERLIGFFANTLALPGDLSGNPTFEELLARVRETCLGAYAHQDLPFEKLVDELQPERSAGHSPIFQVMLMLQNTPSDPVELEGLRIEPARAESITAKFDLVLGAAESRGCVRLGLEYNTDLFDGDRIERMLSQFETLLKAVVSNPKQRIYEVPLLTDSERSRILFEWNDTEHPYPDRRLHQLIEDHVDRTPDVVAIRFEDSTLTYRELDDQANRISHHLATLGMGPGSFVGVAMERSLELIPILLGVLKAGGAYVPLDPDYPEARLAFMAEDARLSVILTQEAVAGMSAYPATRPDIVVDPDHPAYVIYTSGTTGRPKGVVVPHRAVVNHMEWMQQTYPLGPDDRVLQKTPISFDASVWECWAPLMSGGEAIVARPGGHRDSEYLVNLIQQRGVTAVKLVPSLLRMLLEDEQFGECHSLRYIFCGAEALSKELHDRFYAVFGNRVQLSNLYGPTEAAIDAVGYRCNGECATPTVPIGHAIANCTTYILDRNLRQVPIGVPGELYLGGANLATGYMPAPDLTAERFIPNPFAGLLDSRLRENDGELSTLNSQLSTRLYRTGDRCRYLSDGSIEFLGRVDHQVKVRGFRIELGEIEGALRAHPSVRECVVVARGEADAVVLAAYVTGVSIDIGALRQHLKGQLPDYMVPATFTILETMPLTAAGKIDAKALPMPDQIAGADTVEGPRNPTEELVAVIWEELLRRDHVEMTDSFFDVGGHSLLAARVITRIRATFGVDMPLMALFEHPTIAGLSTAIEECRRSGTGLDMPALTARRTSEPAPLSFSQERLWFLFDLDRTSYVYNMPRALRLKGELDFGSLRRALTELLARHEVLRTTYETRDGKALQIIGKPTEFPVEVDDLSTFHYAAREQEALQRCFAEATSPFDLGRDLMLRARLLKLDEREHILLLTIHHIASDGWSNSILLTELTRLYNSFHAGEPTALPELPVQYADFAEWQRGWFVGDVLERQVSYWRERLAGAPPVLELPTDRPRDEATGHSGARRRFLIPPDVADRVRELSRDERATQFMTLLAAFNVLLRHWTGRTDLVVGTDSAGRSLPEVERLIGFFLNHLVIRTDMSGDPTFREAVRRVREICLGAYAHQDLPFDKLVEVMQPERGVSHTPIFQVLFVMQNTPRDTTHLTGLEIAKVESEFPASKFDLGLFLAETSGGLTGLWVYRTELFDAATIERLSRQFLWLLGDLTTNPDRPIEDIEIPHDPVDAAGEETQFAAVKAVRRRAVVST